MARCAAQTASGRECLNQSLSGATRCFVHGGREEVWSYKVVEAGTKVVGQGFRWVQGKYLVKRAERFKKRGGLGKIQENKDSED